MNKMFILYCDLRRSAFQLYSVIASQTDYFKPSDPVIDSVYLKYLLEHLEIKKQEVAAILRKLKKEGGVGK